MPANCANAAPPPTIIALPRPEAVPARCGRTDKRPAVTFGSAMPLPRPKNAAAKEDERMVEAEEGEAKGQAEAKDDE